MKEIKELIKEIKTLLIRGEAPDYTCFLSEKNYAKISDLIDILTNRIDEMEKIHNYIENSMAAGTSEDATKEMVNHPTHYNNGKIECIDAMLDVFGRDKVLAFCELNAFKYLWRSDAKGTDLQDKQKAIWYINEYTELSQKNK